MIRNRLIVTLCILIFFASFLECVFLGSQIKADYLPINKGMTPEQVIESKYSGLKYKYKIYGDIMFVCVDTASGGSKIATAFRNDSSGFMFKVPGYFSWPLQNGRNGYDIIKGTIYPVYYFIGKKSSVYYVVISDINIKNVDFYQDGTKMYILESENSGDKYWIATVKNLTDLNEIYGMYMGEKTHILDASEIKKLFGE